MKKILLLTTGGTIASEQGSDGLTPKLKGEQLIEAIPKLAGLCELVIKDILNVDSTNMQPEEWKAMASAAYEGLKTFDGVVITHGTDTMAYTSAMLSFMLKNLDKPVILTGSQKPIGESGTDAKNNILDAVRVAEKGYPGVYIVFGGKIIKGTRASKVHTTEFSAFDSINTPFAGEVICDRVTMVNPLLEGIDKLTLDVGLDNEVDSRVFLLKLIPGTNPEVIDSIVQMKYYRGIVIEAFGLGGLPNVRRSLLEPIQRALNAGIIVVVLTQCRFGKTDLTEYEVGRKALTAGVIPVSNMTIEAVVTKLMWALSHTHVTKEIGEIMQSNLCGEIDND